MILPNLTMVLCIGYANDFLAACAGGHALGQHDGMCGSYFPSYAVLLYLNSDVQIYFISRN